MKLIQKTTSILMVTSLLSSMPLWSTEGRNEIDACTTNIKTLSISEQPDYNDIMHAEYDNIENKNLKGDINPEEVMDCINEILYPKYMTLAHPGFAPKAIDVDPEAQQEILDFVTENAQHLGVITDPKMMIFFLRLLQPLDVTSERFFVCFNDHNFYLSQNIKRWRSSDNGMLYHQADKKTQQKCFDFPKCDESMKHNTLNFNVCDSHNQIHDKNPIKEKIFQESVQGVNHVFTIAGKQYHNISTDGAALNDLFNNWFKINRALMAFEIKEWEEKALLLKHLDKDYQFVNASLNANNNKLYSGLATGSHSLGLIRTSKQELAENKQTLREFAREEYEGYAQARTNYEEAKPALSVFKRALAWLDEIADIMKKSGRMS